MFNLVFPFVFVVAALDVMTKSSLGRYGLSHLTGCSLSLGESRAGTPVGNLESGSEVQTMQGHFLWFASSSLLSLFSYPAKV